MHIVGFYTVLQYIFRQILRCRNSVAQRSYQMHQHALTNRACVLPVTGILVSRHTTDTWPGARKELHERRSALRRTSPRNVLKQGWNIELQCWRVVDKQPARSILQAQRSPWVPATKRCRHWQLIIKPKRAHQHRVATRPKTTPLNRNRLSCKLLDFFLEKANTFWHTTEIHLFEPRAYHKWSYPIINRFMWPEYI